MMLRNDEGYHDMPHIRDEASSASKRLSVSTGSRSNKSPRVVGWKGETVDAFRPISIEVSADHNVTSPLNSATSFRSGKMFWQKLLEEKHAPDLSPSSGSETSTSEYAEIHLTGSSVSSISNHSGFRGLKNSLSVDIPPSSASLHSLSVSSIDNQRTSRDCNTQKIINPVSTSSNDKHDHHQRSTNQRLCTNRDGKKSTPSPVAYPFGMLPVKSPRFKTTSESFASPKASFDCEHTKNDISTTTPPVVEQHLSTTWATAANNNKVKARLTVPAPVLNKNDRFRSAYGAWQRAGLMKENLDDSDSTREQLGAPSRMVQEVTEGSNSVPDKNIGEGTQVLKGDDAVQYYTAWQRAGLMKMKPGLKLNMTMPTRQSESAGMKPTKTERHASSGIVRKAPDTNGNPYRVWQKVGLMKSGRRNEDRQFRPSKPMALPMAPSTVANIREVPKQKGEGRTLTEERSMPMALPLAPSTVANVREVPKQKGEGRIPTEERSMPMVLPLAPSTVANVRKVPNREPFERTPTDESADQDDEFTNILNSIRNKSDAKENSPMDSREGNSSKKTREKKGDCDSESSHRQRVGGLSIQTASDNGSTIDFFDQMRVQLSPRANVRSSPASSGGRGQNSFGKDEPYQRSPANSSSIFRTSDSKKNEYQGFEATIRDGKEKLNSWEEKTPESRNRPKPNHFQQICRSVESSETTEGPLASLGGTRAIVLLERDNKYEVLVGQTNQSSNQQQLVLNNLEVIALEKTDIKAECDGACQCSRSVFSGNDNLIDFFLPQMGMACTCRERNWVCANPDDPTAIENVLRPWQVQFLHRFGITHAEELVKARHRSVGILGKAMRQWRMKEGMQTLRTSSCIMALDIWSKTCKAYVRSVRKQLGPKVGMLGTREMPRTLISEISKFLMENPPTQTPQKSFDAIVA
ncbi:MAG: hypothetical protein SGBAC_000427 [Bacillariaceae sp.]